MNMEAHWTLLQKDRRGERTKSRLHLFYTRKIKKNPMVKSRKGRMGGKEDCALLKKRINGRKAYRTLVLCKKKKKDEWAESRRVPCSMYAEKITHMFIEKRGFFLWSLIWVLLLGWVRSGAVYQVQEHTCETERRE